MEKCLCFIDEAGDAGLSSGRSSHFIIASVVIASESECELIRSKIAEYKKSLGWSMRDEFKFSRTRKELIKDLLSLLSPYDYQVFCVVLDKNKGQFAPPIKDRYSLYNYVLAELIKILPKGCNAKIIIDGDVGKRYKKNILTFLRKQASDDIHITNLQFFDSRSREELQLADLVVGSINRSYSNRKDSQDYIKLIKDKIKEIRNL